MPNLQKSFNIWMFPVWDQKNVEEYLFIMSLNNSNNLIPIHLNLLFSYS